MLSETRLLWSVRTVGSHREPSLPTVPVLYWSADDVLLGTVEAQGYAIMRRSLLYAYNRLGTTERLRKASGYRKKSRAHHHAR